MTDESFRNPRKEKSFDDTVVKRLRVLKMIGVALRDPASHREYYVDPKSGRTSWERASDDADGELCAWHVYVASFAGLSSPFSQCSPRFFSDPWTERISSSTRRRYYFNMRTREARWGRPVAGTGGKWRQLFDDVAGRSFFVEQGSDAASGRWTLPAGVGDADRIWIEVRQPTSGVTYFYCPSTEEASWARPMPGTSPRETVSALLAVAAGAAAAGDASKVPSAPAGRSGSAPAGPLSSPISHSLARPASARVSDAVKRNSEFFRQQKLAKQEKEREEKQAEEEKLGRMEPEDREAYLKGKDQANVHEKRKTLAMKKLMRQNSSPSLRGLRGMKSKRRMKSPKPLPDGG